MPIRPRFRVGGGGGAFPLFGNIWKCSEMFRITGSPVIRKYSDIFVNIRVRMDGKPGHNSATVAMTDNSAGDGSEQAGDDVLIRWVPSHLGVAGNHRAHQMAELGIEIRGQHQKGPVEEMLTPSDVSSTEREVLQGDWDGDFLTAEVGASGSGVARWETANIALRGQASARTSAIPAGLHATPGRGCGQGHMRIRGAPKGAYGQTTKSCDGFTFDGLMRVHRNCARVTDSALLGTGRYPDTEWDHIGVQFA